MSASARGAPRTEPTGHGAPQSRPAFRPHGVIETKISGAHDDEEATAILRSIDGSDIAVERLVGCERSTLDAVAIAFGDVRVTRLKLSGWSLSQTLKREALIVFPIEGQVTFLAGDSQFVVPANRQAAIARPFNKFALQVERGEIVMLRAPVEALCERATKLGCISCGETPDFSCVGSVLELAQPVAESLARTTKSAIVDTAFFSAVNMSGLIVDGFESLLLNMAAAALFPCAIDCERHPPRESLFVLRRARDHIETHASQSVKLSSLAKTLGMSMRALQVGFKRAFGCSPRDFIIECRLEKARKMLLEARREASITQIALDCGFGDLSHFSAKYRRKYGELPSETIRFLSL